MIRRRKRRRPLVVILVSALALVVGGGALFWMSGLAGSSFLERSIGRQLQNIANSYLNPQLTFDDLDYQYPATVSLKNMRLVAEDPANPGEPIDILACGQATITLAEIPKIGKSIVIEKIILNQPLFSAISEGPGSRKLIGFSNLIRGRTPSTATSAAPPTSRPRLSDVFNIRQIQLIDGRIVYNPRVPGAQAMDLDKINTTLDVQPTEAGWYKLSTDLARKPVFDMSIAGQFNLDTLTTRDIALTLTADLSQDKINYLPPQLQQLLKQYEVSGSLDARVMGNVPLRDPLKGDISTEIKLNKGNVTLGDYRIPVENLEASATLSQGKLTLPKFKLAALQGSADIQGSARLDGDLDSDVTLKISQMELKDLMAGNKNTSRQMAGKIDANLQATAPLKVVLAKTKPSTTNEALAQKPLPAHWGSATINITNATLVQLPVIHQVSDSIASAAKIIQTAVNQLPEANERATFAFDFNGSQMDFHEIDYVGRFVAVRGTGSISLDQNVDLKVHGGPVEKVQALLGKEVGGAFGRVTDALLAYHVTGTIKDPKIGVEVGGRAGNKALNVGKDVSSGLQRVGEGIGNIIKSIDGN